MTIPVLEYISPGVQKPRPLLSLLEKIVLIALGVLLPLLCFVLASMGYLLEPDWQSGGWDRYLVFIPDGRVGFSFYPLLIYCMIALSVFVFNPKTSHRLLVRFGLYTGIVLAMQYTVIQALAAKVNFIAAVSIGLGSNFILLGVVKGLERVPRKVLIYSAIGLVLVTAVSLALVPLAGMRHGNPADLLLGAGVLTLFFAPAWCCGVYVRASLLAMRLNRKPDDAGFFSLGLLAWIPWLGAYGGAWKWSIANAIVMYAKLPPSQPGCYIATAAAAGHRGFVGSSPAVAADGSIFPANQQLRRLKCVEIAIAAVWPSMHGMIRRSYDRIGPPLARVIAWHPLLADVAFVKLKPVEWLAFGLLVAAVPDARLKMRSLYPATRSA